MPYHAFPIKNFEAVFGPLRSGKNIFFRNELLKTSTLAGHVVSKDSNQYVTYLDDQNYEYIVRCVENAGKETLSPDDWVIPQGYIATPDDHNYASQRLNLPPLQSDAVASYNTTTNNQEAVVAAGEIEIVRVPAEMLLHLNSQNTLEPGDIYDYRGNRRGYLDGCDDGIATVICMNQHTKWFEFQAAKFNAPLAKRVLSVRYDLQSNIWRASWDFDWSFNTPIGAPIANYSLDSLLRDVATCCGIDTSEIDYLIRPNQSQYFIIQDGADEIQYERTEYRAWVQLDNHKMFSCEGDTRAEAINRVVDVCRRAHIAVEIVRDQVEPLLRAALNPAPDKPPRPITEPIPLPKHRVHRTMSL